MSFPRVPRIGARGTGVGRTRAGRSPVTVEAATGQPSVSSAPPSEAEARNWRIVPDGIIDPGSGKRYNLVRHGLDEASARDQVVHSRVVLGRFPLAQEITGDVARIRDALRELSTSGAHFSYFASLYGIGGDGLLLVDYIS